MRLSPKPTSPKSNTPNRPAAPGRSTSNSRSTPSPVQTPFRLPALRTDSPQSSNTPSHARLARWRRPFPARDQPRRKPNTRPSPFGVASSQLPFSWSIAPLDVSEDASASPRCSNTSAPLSWPIPATSSSVPSLIANVSSRNPTTNPFGSTLTSATFPAPTVPPSLKNSEQSPLIQRILLQQRPQCPCAQNPCAQNRCAHESSCFFALFPGAFGRARHRRRQQDRNLRTRCPSL